MKFEAKVIQYKNKKTNKIHTKTVILPKKYTDRDKILN